MGDPGRWHRPPHPPNDSLLRKLVADITAAREEMAVLRCCRPLPAGDLLRDLYAAQVLRKAARDRLRSRRHGSALAAKDKAIWAALQMPLEATAAVAASWR